jgi:hypothetical protein
LQKEKISRAVTSALTYIEEAIEAHTKSDEKNVIQLTWKAASDLEYVLFLFSIMHKDEKRNSSRKLPSSKQLEIESLLTSVQSLLKEAIEHLEADDLNETHKKTWIAKGQLLRLHDFFWKKQKKAQKLF